MVRDVIKNQYHKDFIIEEGQQWLLQGWKSRILLAHSMWVADGARSDCYFFTMKYVQIWILMPDRVMSYDWCYYVEMYIHDPVDLNWWHISF